MVTSNEKKVMDITADLSNEFKKLPQLHPDDIKDFNFHLHAIQNIILCRSAYRVLNNIDTPKEEVY